MPPPSQTAGCQGLQALGPLPCQTAPGKVVPSLTSPARNNRLRLFPLRCLWHMYLSCLRDVHLLCPQDHPGLVKGGANRDYVISNLRELFSKADYDRNGTLNCLEFIAFMYDQCAHLSIFPAKAVLKMMLVLFLKYRLCPYSHQFCPKAHRTNRGQPLLSAAQGGP